MALFKIHDRRFADFDPCGQIGAPSFHEKAARQCIRKQWLPAQPDFRAGDGLGGKL
jgi:hypothetical protein